MTKTRYMTSTELTEIAALVERLEEQNTSVTFEVRVLDENGIELGAIRRVEDDGIHFYAFEAEKGGEQV